MGTVVFPDAGLKIFLDAGADERARRRLIQLRKGGIAANIAALREEIRERDVRDRSRTVSPLMPADDAVTIDTTELPVEHIATRCGFGSATGLRVHFRRATGTTPQRYRRAFRVDPVEGLAG